MELSNKLQAAAEVSPHPTILKAGEQSSGGGQPVLNFEWQGA